MVQLPPEKPTPELLAEGLTSIERIKPNGKTKNKKSAEKEPKKPQDKGKK